MERDVVVGVDLGGTNLRAGRVEGEAMAALRRRAVSSRASEAAVVIDEIVDTVEQVMAPGVAGIGIGVPSIVDVEGGIVYAVENIPSWHEVHLKEALESRFHLPVQVNNDANCFALGELYYGQGRGYRHLVGLTIGTGLGAGVVVDGRLYSGRNCGAGEIGCIPHREKTIEYYCSGQFFSREAGVAGDLLFARAEQGDPAALELFHRFGVEVGHALMTVLYAYDPEIVVLGGAVSSAFPHFRRGMEEKLAEFAYPTALARLKIVRSEDPEIPVLGAAALVLDAQRQAAASGGGKR